jgi:hypothetical protein
MPIYNQTLILDLTPTISAGSAYAAGDVVGGLLTFNVYSAGGGGTIRRIALIDSDNEKAALRLYLFSTAPTSIADNAAFAPSAADLKKLLDVVAFAADDYTTVNSRAFIVERDLDLDYETADGRVYGYLVCDATPTYTAASDLTIRLTAWVD